MVVPARPAAVVPARAAAVVPARPAAVVPAWAARSRSCRGNRPCPSCCPSPDPRTLLGTTSGTGRPGLERQLPRPDRPIPNRAIAAVVAAMRAISSSGNVTPRMLTMKHLGAQAFSICYMLRSGLLYADRGSREVTMVSDQSHPLYESPPLDESPPPDRRRPTSPPPESPPDMPPPPELSDPADGPPAVRRSARVRCGSAGIGSGRAAVRCRRVGIRPAGPAQAQKCPAQAQIRGFPVPRVHPGHRVRYHQALRVHRDHRVRCPPAALRVHRDHAHQDRRVHLARHGSAGAAGAHRAAAVPTVAAATGSSSPGSTTVTRPAGSTRPSRQVPGSTRVTGPTGVAGPTRPTRATGSAGVMNDRRWPVDDCRSVVDDVRG